MSEIEKLRAEVERLNRYAGEQYALATQWGSELEKMKLQNDQMRVALKRISTGLIPITQMIGIAKEALTEKRKCVHGIEVGDGPCGLC